MMLVFRLHGMTRHPFILERFWVFIPAEVPISGGSYQIPDTRPNSLCQTTAIDYPSFGQLVITAVTRRVAGKLVHAAPVHSRKMAACTRVHA